MSWVWRDVHCHAWSNRLRGKGTPSFNMKYYPRMTLDWFWPRALLVAGQTSIYKSYLINQCKKINVYFRWFIQYIFYFYNFRQFIVQLYVFFTIISSTAFEDMKFFLSRIPLVQFSFLFVIYRSNSSILAYYNCISYFCL